MSERKWETIKEYQDILFEGRHGNDNLMVSSFIVHEHLAPYPGACEIFLTSEKGFGLIIHGHRIFCSIFLRNLPYIIGIICTVVSLGHFASGELAHDYVFRIILQDKVSIRMDLPGHRTVREPAP